MNLKDSYSSIRTKVKIFFLNLSSKKKVIGGILGILILTGAIGAGIYLVQQRQSTKTRAGGVDLVLSSSNQNPKVGDTFTVAISMNTNGESVSAADLRVRYDTAILEATGIKASGTSFPTVLMPGIIDGTNTASGRAWIVVGCLIDSSGAFPKSGTGLLAAEITFKAKAAGTANLTFGSATAVAVVGQTVSAVGTMNPLSITVQGATGSPSPAPSGSPSAKKGDINGDGVVNVVDLGILIDNYGKSPLPNPKADLNGDGAVTVVDLGILIDNYGK